MISTCVFRNILLVQEFLSFPLRDMYLNNLYFVCSFRMWKLMVSHLLFSCANIPEWGFTSHSESLLLIEVPRCSGLESREHLAVMTVCKKDHSRRLNGLRRTWQRGKQSIMTGNLGVMKHPAACQAYSMTPNPPNTPQ